jgi:hypothetical protein
MASLDLTAFAAALKTLYPSEAIRNLVYQNNPLFALMPKDESFTGASSTEPITYGTPQNRSNTFSNANTVNTTSLIKAFLLTRKQNYSMASIANEALMASRDDKGAFLRAAKYEIDNALLALTRSIAQQVYRSGTGTIGQISASATINSASTAVAMINPEQIVNLEVGMAIAFSATDGGAARSGTAYVVVIDRAAGTFLCSGTVNGSPASLASLVSGVAVSDYIYQNAGDINLAITGLSGWLAGSDIANSGDSFFGINRAADKVRLGGIKYDGSSQTVEEAIIDAAGVIAREGGRPDMLFISFKDFRNLVKAVGSRQIYTDVNVDEAKVRIGFTALVLNTAVGAVKVVPDLNCPVGVAFLLQMDTWKLKSLGEAVNLFDGDGLMMIRDASSDALNIRCFSYAQVSCRAPGFNARILLPS